MPNACILHLTGHAGSDPTTKQVGKGTVTEFSLAYNPYVRESEEKRTTWFRVSFWGRDGERAAEHIKKGSAISVVGELDIRPFRDKNGNERTSNDVRGLKWFFAGSRADAGNPAQKREPGSDDEHDPTTDW